MRNLIGIVAFCFLLACPALAGQAPAPSAPSDGADDDLPRQSAQPGVTDLAWKLHLEHPGLSVSVRKHYPQGFGPQIDASLGADAWRRFDDTCSEMLKGVAETGEEHRAAIAASLAKSASLPSGDDGLRVFPLFDVTTYAVFRPSADHVSLLFKTESYSGGAHGMRSYDAVSFDLRTGGEIGLADVFPRAKAVPERLVARIADGVQALKEAGTEPAARDPESVDVRMARIVLTEEGMRVVYSPYEMGSYAEGEFLVDIPKKELLAMGANPALWEKK